MCVFVVCHFFKSLFPKNSIRNTIRVLNSFDPDPLVGKVNLVHMVFSANHTRAILVPYLVDIFHTCSCIPSLRTVLSR